MRCISVPFDNQWFLAKALEYFKKKLKSALEKKKQQKPVPCSHAQTQINVHITRSTLGQLYKP